MKKKTPQMLQAHAFMISHSNKLAARGGKEVPATNHSDLFAVVLFLGSPVPLLFFATKPHFLLTESP
jgi:hypothetical protein